MNTTSAPAVAEAAPPYPSLAAMRAVHGNLLLRQRETHNSTAFQEDVRAFLACARATGTLLDTDADRSTAQALIDYWVTALFRANREEQPELTLAEFDPKAVGRDLADNEYPYEVMGSARVGNHQLLLGTQRLVEQCLRRIEAHHLVVIAGPPGSGRSSLVHASLLPALADGELLGSAQWRQYSIAGLGSSPLTALARLFARPDDATTPALEKQVALFRADSSHLAKLLAQSGDAPAVLAIDRVEDLFRCNSADREAFLKNVFGLITGAKAIHAVILIVRSEFMAQMDQLDQLKTLMQQVLLYVAFNTDELRSAIEEPAKLIGLRFDEGLVDRLILDIQGDPASISLLQFTLRKLWAGRERNRITWATYNRIGGGRLALQRAAETAYRSLSLDEQKAAQRIFLQIVRPDAGLDVVVNPVAKASLYPPDSNRITVDAALSKFIAAGLLCEMANPPLVDTNVTLAHEALVGHWPRLIEWLSDERDSKRRRLRLTAAAEQWQESNHHESALWGGSMLEEAKGYADRSKLEDEFLRESEALQARQARRERNNWLLKFVAVVIIAFLSVAIMLVFLFREHFAKEKIEKQVVAMIVERGLRSIEDADLTGSGMFFSRAHEFAMNSDVQRADIHRMRIGAGLRQLPRLSQILYHKDLISAAFSADGKSIVSTGPNGSVWIWDAMTGTRTDLRGPSTLRATCAAFSPSGDLVVVGYGRDTSNDKGEVAVWNWKSGKRWTLSGWQGGAVTFVDFHPNGQLVLAAGEAGGPKKNRGEARLLKADTGEKLVAMPHEVGIVNFAAFDSLGNQVVTAAGQSGGKVGEAQIWYIKPYADAIEVPLSGAGNKEPIKVPFSGAVNHAEFSPDGQFVVFAADAHGGESGHAQIVSVAAPKQRPRNLDHRAGVTWAAFSPDGSKVVTASHDGTAQIWDWTSARILATLNHGSSVFSAAFSPDGRYVVTGSRDRTARVWETSTGEAITPPLYDTGTITLALFSNTGDRILAASSDTIRIWNLTTDNKAPKTLDTTTYVRQMIPCDNGKRVLTLSDVPVNNASKSFNADSRAFKAQLWNTLNGEQITKPLTHDSRMLSCATVSADGKWVATAAWDAAKKSTEIWLWDAEVSAKKISILVKEHVLLMVLSEDGAYLVTASPDSKQPGMQHLRLWDTMNGMPCGEPQPVDAVNCAAFSRDNRWLATGTGKLTDDTGEVQVWSTEKFTRLRCAKPLLHKPDLGGVLHVAFSPNGQFLVSASADDSAKLWSIANDQVKAFGNALPHTADVTFAAFNAEGDKVITVSMDRNVSVWERDSGKRIANFEHPKIPNHAAFHSMKGKNFVATASSDGTARVWEWDESSRGELVTIFRHPGIMHSVSFHEKGRHLISLSYRMRSADKPSVSMYNFPAMPGSYAAPLALTRQVQSRVWNLDAYSHDAPYLTRLGKVLGARQLDGNNNLKAIQDLKADEKENKEEWTVNDLVHHWQDIKGEYHRNSTDRTDVDHPKEADECEATDQWFAAWWHLNQLKEPLERTTLNRRARAAYRAWKQRAHTELDLTKLLQAARDDYKKGGIVDTKEMAELWGALANALKLARKWDDAISVYHDAIELKVEGYQKLETELVSLERKDQPFWQNLVSRFENQGQWDKVIEFYTDAHKFDETKSYYLEKLVTAFERVGKSKEADEVYAKATKLDPKNFQIRQDRGLTNYNARRWAAAAQNINEALEIQPRNYWLLQFRARILGNLDRWQEAVESYDQACKLQPNIAWLWMQRAQAEAEVGDWKGAAKSLEKADELARQQDRTLWRALALVRLKEGNLAEYRKLCDRTAKTFGTTTQADVANSVAWTCVLAPAAVEDPNTVVNLAQRAVNLAPNIAGYHNTLGAALFRAGRFDLSVERLNAARMQRKDEKAVTGEEGAPLDFLFLAMANLQLGQAEEARKCLDIAVRKIEEASRTNVPDKAVASVTWDRIELEWLRLDAETALNPGKK